MTTIGGFNTAAGLSAQNAPRVVQDDTEVRKEPATAEKDQEQAAASAQPRSLPPGIGGKLDLTV